MGRQSIIGEHLWDRSLAQAVDRITSQRFGIPPLVLMEVAGRGVFDFVMEGDPDERPVLILCGTGNNGGDGLVAARHLAEARLDVHVYIVSPQDPPKFSESCAAQHRTLEALGHSVRTYERGCFNSFDGEDPIVIDALFGLGFKGPLAKDSIGYHALSELNALEGKTVIAVDLPSGLDADCAVAQDVPLPADITITFGGKKPAQVLSPARDACGIVVALDIGFPMAAVAAALEEHQPRYHLVEPESLLFHNPWSRLPRSAHKYDRGHVLVIGGSAGKAGAPLMAALAALRSGAGWASVSMPKSAMGSLRGDVPLELTFEDLFDGENLDGSRLEQFLKERQVKSVVVGPGSMKNPLTESSLEVLSRFSEAELGFVVFDAGATHGLSDLAKVRRGHRDQWLCTPHPGEWKKMADDVAPPLTPAGYEVSKKLATQLQSTLMFKSATPLVVTPEPTEPAYVTNEGSLILARAGSGDVLSGVAAAHGAAGFDAPTAALRSQVVVARASEIAAAKVGPHAVLATDIIEYLGRLEDHNEEEEDEE